LKALVLDRPGQPETMYITELPLPEPGPGEIRVRIQAASLNPIDYKVAPNGHPSWKYPFVLGVDAAGVVDALGEGVTQWNIGDRVVYHSNFTKHGTYAQYNVTTAHTVAALPQELSFEKGAAFPCAGLTAYQCLHRKMNLKAGQTVLIHGGAGGVGGYAIQLARLVGAKIITTASSRNFDYVKQLGAHEVIDYNTENVAARVMEMTNGLGVDAILNTINRQSAQADLDMLAFGGQLACIAGSPENVADTQPPSKSITVHKVMLGGAHLSEDHRAQADLGVMAGEFAQLLMAKKLNPMIAETIALEDVPQALTRLSERHVRGKIVVRIG
jgi:NADPH2:quinone reductase